jgi:transcriptional regulator
MYIPEHFKVSDDQELTRFIQTYSFGSLISQVEQAVFATHLPFLYKESDGKPAYLAGHLAKGNPHWKNLEGSQVLVLFQGPHAYISPSWYAEKQTVPTWNYTAVHVYGRFSILHEAKELKQLIVDTVKFYEPESELLQHLDEQYYEQMLQGIVGFQVEIARIEGKYKLSQNKSAETQQRIIDALRSSADPEAVELADFMDRYRKQPLTF